MKISHRCLGSIGGKFLFAVFFALIIFGWIGRIPAFQSAAELLLVAPLLGFGFLLAWGTHHLLGLIFGERTKAARIGWGGAVPLLILALVLGLREADFFAFQMTSSDWESNWSLDTERNITKPAGRAAIAVGSAWPGASKSSLRAPLDAWVHRFQAAHPDLLIRVEWKLDEDRSGGFLPLYKPVEWRCLCAARVQLRSADGAWEVVGRFEIDFRLEGAVSGLSSGPGRDREATQQVAIGVTQALDGSLRRWIAKARGA